MTKTEKLYITLTKYVLTNWNCINQPLHINCWNSRCWKLESSRQRTRDPHSSPSLGAALTYLAEQTGQANITAADQAILSHISLVGFRGYYHFITPPILYWCVKLKITLLVQWMNVSTYFFEIFHCLSLANLYEYQLRRMVDTVYVGLSISRLLWNYQKYKLTSRNQYGAERKKVN